MARNILILLSLALLSACAGGSGNADAVSPIEKDTTEAGDTVIVQENEETEAMDTVKAEEEGEAETDDTESSKRPMTKEEIIKEFSLDKVLDTTFICKKSDIDAQITDSILKSRGVIGKDEKAVYKKRECTYEGENEVIRSFSVYYKDKLVYDEYFLLRTFGDRRHLWTAYDFNKNRLYEYENYHGPGYLWDSVSVKSYKNGVKAQSLGYKRSELDIVECLLDTTYHYNFKNHERKTEFNIRLIMDSVLEVRDIPAKGKPRNSLFSAKERDIVKLLNGMLDSLAKEHRELDLWRFYIGEERAEFRD